MKQYLSLLEEILEKGVKREDRTGIGTISLFGAQRRYSLNPHFPLLTTKKVHLKSIIYELLWFLQGDTNIKYLNDNGVSIWNEWADANGELGPIYGKQWTAWDGKDGKKINQIQNVIEMIKSNPNSRRIIVSGWNVADLQELISGKKTAPPPCHTIFQFYVANNKLSCQLYQRSADVFLGVPFNIASYSLLTMMIAQVTGLMPHEFIHTMGDVHIYLNHLGQVQTQLARTLKELPIMKINPGVKDIFNFKYEDFTLEGYNPEPGIKAPIAI